jgi:hypothetical protein
VGGGGWVAWGRKEGLLFEKRSKNFHPLASPSPGGERSQWMKVFWFFFSKKNRLLSLLGP